MADTLDLIAGEGERLLALTRSEPDRPVPQYPDWTITDLLSHTGAILGRTTIVCRDRAQERVSAPRPSEDDDVLEWFAARLRDTIEVLSASDPATPVWGFGSQPSIGFWLTRMLIEVGIHRWDAERALGRPIPLLDEVATAGLDEFGDMWLPRLGEPATMLLRATDLGADWQYGPGDPVYTVEGTGSDLYLRLMSRPSPVAIPEEWAIAVDALEPPPR